MKSNLYIVNTTERPAEAFLAIKREEDGKFYYVHPELIWDNRYHGMTPRNPTPVEDFGITIAIEDGVVIGEMTGQSVAMYHDGRPRQWQGSRSFKFQLDRMPWDLPEEESDLDWTKIFEISDISKDFFMETVIAMTVVDDVTIIARWTRKSKSGPWYVDSMDSETREWQEITTFGGDEVVPRNPPKFYH